jgi:hypothetical protein
MNDFYKQLIAKSWIVVAIVTLLSILQWVTSYFSKTEIMTYAISIVAFIKIALVVQLSFKQLTKIIGQTHLITHILTLFTFLIGLIIISFTVDYATLYLNSADSFKISDQSMIATGAVLYEFLYFSTITFSSVGYGDTVPVSVAAKLIVMLQVAVRFFVLVFGIANINQIKVNQ